MKLFYIFLLSNFRSEILSLLQKDTQFQDLSKLTPQKASLARLQTFLIFGEIRSVELKSLSAGK